MNQLDFDTLEPGFASDSEKLRAQADKIYALIRDIADYHRGQTVAQGIGRSPASVSQALRPKHEQRNGHSFKVDDLPWLLSNAPNDDLINYLVSLREKPATKGEQLTALAEAAREYLGPEVHKGLLRAAQSRLISNRRKKAG